MQEVSEQEKVKSANGMLQVVAKNGNSTVSNGNKAKMTKNDKSFSSMSDRSISPTLTISEQ